MDLTQCYNFLALIYDIVLINRVYITRDTNRYTPFPLLVREGGRVNSACCKVVKVMLNFLYNVKNNCRQKVQEVLFISTLFIENTIHNNIIVEASISNHLREFMQNLEKYKAVQFFIRLTSK